MFQIYVILNCVKQFLFYNKTRGGAIRNKLESWSPLDREREVEWIPSYGKSDVLKQGEQK